MTTFDRFRQAPFGPLGDHMTEVRKCVSLVRSMFERVRDNDHDELKRITENIYKTEHEADKIKNRIRDEIPRTFDLPIFRGDLLAYLKLQDDIADTVEDIAVVLTLKNLSIPQGLSDDLLAYVDKVLEVCSLLFECTDQLTDLTEADFEGEKGRAILERVARAEHEEWESDKMEFQLSQKLFALDDTLKATDIFLWSKVFEQLGALANHADKTAERLRRMISR